MLTNILKGLWRDFVHLSLHPFKLWFNKKILAGPSEENDMDRGVDSYVSPDVLKSWGIWVRPSLLILWLLFVDDFKDETDERERNDSSRPKVSQVSFLQQWNKLYGPHLSSLHFDQRKKQMALKIWIFLRSLSLSHQGSRETWCFTLDPQVLLVKSSSIVLPSIWSQTLEPRNCQTRLEWREDVTHDVMSWCRVSGNTWRESWRRDTFNSWMECLRGSLRRHALVIRKGLTRIQREHPRRILYPFPLFVWSLRETF